VRNRSLLGLGLVSGDEGEQIARLSAIEGWTRAVMVGSVPLAALDRLGSTLAVSLAFTVGSGVSIIGTLWIDRLERLVGRRWVVTSGVVAVIAAALMFAYGPAWTIPVAITLRALHASVFSICLALYVMDYIGKKAIVQVESRRATYVALAWLTGPTIGTLMWSKIGHAAPFLAAAAMALALLAYHWRLRFRNNPVLRGPVTPPPNPFGAVRRFFAQRYLRAAYAITLTRAMFWAALFVYGPLYVVDAGLPVWMAGVFLSTASGMLLLSPIVLRASRRVGVRTMLMVGFGLIIVSLTSLTVVGAPRRIGVAAWLIGAVGGGILDVLGNIPFMRLVKPYERTAMTAVFTTWREMSFLLAPGIAALVLLVGPLWLLYPVLAIFAAGGIAAASILPRRI
jgi:ACDE family multidrug resistance protein